MLCTEEVAAETCFGRREGRCDWLLKSSALTKNSLLDLTLAATINENYHDEIRREVRGYNSSSNHSSGSNKSSDSVQAKKIKY